MGKRLTVALAVLALLGVYVGGYFWLGSYVPGFAVARADGPPLIASVRFYPVSFLAAVFRPAARVKTWLTGQPTYAAGEGDEEFAR